MKFKKGDIVIFKFNNFSEKEGIIIGNTENENVYFVQFDNEKINIDSGYLTLKYINNDNDIDSYNYYQKKHLYPHI
jgi:hypothetical protein